MTHPSRRLHVVPPDARARPRSGSHASRAVSRVVARLASVLHTVAELLEWWLDPADVCPTCRLYDIEAGQPCPRCGR